MQVPNQKLENFGKTTFSPLSYISEGLYVISLHRRGYSALETLKKKYPPHQRFVAEIETKTTLQKKPYPVWFLRRTQSDPLSDPIQYKHGLMKRPVILCGAQKCHTGTFVTFKTICTHS